MRMRRSHLRRRRPAPGCACSATRALNHPVTVRALKDLALASERTQVQLVFVAHALTLPEELQPWAAAFEIEPMTPARVSTVLREELTRQRSRSGRDVAGCQRTLESLQRHLTGLPEASVRHLARLALGDGQVTAADLARVLAAKQSALGAAELLVFEAELPTMDEVAGMVALKRWLLCAARPSWTRPRPRACRRRVVCCCWVCRARQEPGGQGGGRVLATAAVPHGLRCAARQVAGRERTQAARGAARGRSHAALRAVDGRESRKAWPAAVPTMAPAPRGACSAPC
jgi:hypothetical protein